MGQRVGPSAAPVQPGEWKGAQGWEHTRVCPFTCASGFTGRAARWLYVTFPLSANITQTDLSPQPAVHINRKSPVKLCLCPGPVRHWTVGREKITVSATDSTGSKQQLGGELF